MKITSNYDNIYNKHNMAIPDNNDMLSLLMRQNEESYQSSKPQIEQTNKQYHNLDNNAENSRVLKPPEG